LGSGLDFEFWIGAVDDHGPLGSGLDFELWISAVDDHGWTAGGPLGSGLDFELWIGAVDDHGWTAGAAGAGVQTLGSGGLVAGGGNSFTFDQANSDSHSLNVDASTNTSAVDDTGTDSYTLHMLGTETFGARRTIRVVSIRNRAPVLIRKSGMWCQII
jgi:hypothetical protein